jgi:lambda repressor-like predicted transcriptional regulator
MTRRHLKLPDEAAQTLRQLYAKAKLHGSDTWPDALFDAYIAKLRQVGWTLASIGVEIGLTGERIRQRQLNATQDAFDSPELPDAPPPPAKPLPPRKIRKPMMRPEFEQWLKETHALARQCRGWHELDSPERLASEHLWAAVNEAIAQGIRPSRIAHVLDVKVITIWAGLRRHGYRNNPPSQKSYKRVVLQFPQKQQDFCKRGHPFSGDNVGISPGRHGRYCRACNRQASRDAYQRRKAARSA